MLKKYHVLATVNGKENTLIQETDLFNQATEACQWAREQGFADVRIIKF